MSELTPPLLYGSVAQKYGSLDLESRFGRPPISLYDPWFGSLLLAAHLQAALMAKRWTIIDAPFIIFPLPIEFRHEGG